MLPSSSLFPILHNHVMCRKTATLVYWKICYFVYIQQLTVYGFMACFILCHNGRRFWHVEQCTVIHFFVQEGRSPKETIDELRNVDPEDGLLPVPTIYRWHKVYWEGRQSFTLLKSSRRLGSQIAKVNVNMVRLIIKEEQNLTVWDMERMTNISKSTIRCILTQNLRMRCVSST